ncbi:MAG TPA: DNA repair protein RecN [Rickettsiales bacterium]|nr:DNA repair protein RecN [Rickettsiales bacterium]
MLTHITIRNIVLIEHCEIPFQRGLCVLTGETGAGKSILLDSLGLALGARAETRLIRHGHESASVHATFDIANNAAARTTLEELGLEDADELIVRRTITADGKTKCFVNDVAVSVAALKALGERLVEVHGQHDGRGLLDPSTHREILDLHGELQTQADGVADAYQQWQSTRQKLAQAQSDIQAAEREKDYLQHMQKELGTLAPQPDEENTLADSRTTMMQSEKLADTLKDALSELNTGKGVAGMLGAAHRVLARSPMSNDNRFAAALEALDRAATEAGEAEVAIENLLRDSQYDPAKLEQIEERLFAIRAAARKYNVPAEQLAALLADVTNKLNSISNQEHEIGHLQKAEAEAREKYLTAAQKLSKQREKAGKSLEKAVDSELDSLKMSATQFNVLIESLPEERWSANGIDSVQFQAATNKGASLAPLHKIASGGELSRFMLAMKVALAKVKSTPSLIFDEIDTGTGGAVADAIGKRLSRLGQTHQVLVVTHLPQVAAQGSQHLRIMKKEKAGATFTQVHALSDAERKEELARMLAGAEITSEARMAADKLLQAAG